MTFLMLHKEGATIAHVGDSRVYQIRPLKNEDRAEFIFQTEDHSLVNDLIKIGELTPEDAENYPRKNVITRALQPHLEHRYKADIVTLKDIRPNDFFICVLMVCSKKLPMPISASCSISKSLRKNSLRC